MGRCYTCPVTPLAIVLVLLSALLHSTWNLLLKRAANQEVFAWWLLASAGAVLLPMGAFLLWREPIVQPGWWFVLGTIAIHIFYFTLLARGYARADLSLVYPIARGAGPGLVPVLGVVILGESIAPAAAAGIVMVVLGIFVVHWWGRFAGILRDPLDLLKQSGMRYALLTGVTIAAYSVWDKEGVQYVHPFLYGYLLVLGSAFGMAPRTALTYGRRAMAMEWQRGWPAIVAAGLMTFLAYALVLTALTFSPVSYVAPTREVGIVFAVLLGALFLHERVGVGRLLGSSLIVLGLVIIGVSP